MGSRERAWRVALVLQVVQEGKGYRESCELSFEVRDGSSVGSSFFRFAAPKGQMGSAAAAAEDVPSRLELAYDLLQLESAGLLERLEEELASVELDRQGVSSRPGRPQLVLTKYAFTLASCAPGSVSRSRSVVPSIPTPLRRLPCGWRTASAPHRTWPSVLTSLSPSLLRLVLLT